MATTKGGQFPCRDCGKPVVWAQARSGKWYTSDPITWRGDDSDLISRTYYPSHRCPVRDAAALAALRWTRWRPDGYADHTLRFQISKVARAWVLSRLDDRDENGKRLAPVVVGEFPTLAEAKAHAQQIANEEAGR